MTTLTSSTTIKSDYVILTPTVQRVPYYCTETDWRNYTGFTNTTDFPSNEVTLHLENATEQVKKDAFFMIRYELCTKDSEGRYFTARRYWGNRYGRETAIEHDKNSKYDLQVWEADVHSSIVASLNLEGSRVNKIFYPIPYDGITDFDPLNCWFKLSSGYPTVDGRQIFVTYWVCGKPFNDINYELKRACMEMVTILALNKLKTKRMKKGVIQYTLGKQTMTRDEKTFDAMIADHKKEYDKWVSWCKPFIGRRMRIGRMETDVPGRYINRY